DNASGSAGALVLAAAFADTDTAHDFRLVLFGGEEQGLLGSRRYLDTLDPSERRRIAAVVNMDMIGVRNGPIATVLIEGAPVSRALVAELADAAALHTGLAVETSMNPYASDHVPFIEAGIPAVLTIEGADGANEAIHTAGDTPDRLDHAFALDILRMNAAVVARYLRTAGAGDGGGDGDGDRVRAEGYPEDLHPARGVSDDI
ncbi:MAG TPA: M28 family peptidase, partial [Arenibaculum sp.]|nr:M28 family peptidase [Arenibaculum sp.]